MEEAKQELKDVVEFLRNPERFKRLGGKMPTGAQSKYSVKCIGFFGFVGFITNLVLLRVNVCCVFSFFQGCY